MKIDVLSLFPEMFVPLKESIIGRALKKNLVNFNIINFRKYSQDKQKSVDDLVYGGGAGMLLAPQPVFSAIDHIKEINNGDRGHIILVDPTGLVFNNEKAKDLSKYKHLVFISGHYEGYDERIRSLADEEISIGDYILTGGELPTMVMIDAIVRLLDGALGNSLSTSSESFQNNLLEEPQYTRPANFHGLKVPQVLMSGDHKKIKNWRLKESLKKTYLRRPDLLKKRKFSKEELKFLEQINRKFDKKD